jgi:hypothetical protein
LTGEPAPYQNRGDSIGGDTMKAAAGVGVVLGIVLLVLYLGDCGLFGTGSGDRRRDAPARPASRLYEEPRPERPTEAAPVPETTSLTVGRDSVFAGTRALSWEEVDAVIESARGRGQELNVAVRGTAVEATVAELRRRLERSGVRYNLVSERP